MFFTDIPYLAAPKAAIQLPQYTPADAVRSKVVSSEGGTTGNSHTTRLTSSTTTPAIDEGIRIMTSPAGCERLQSSISSNGDCRYGNQRHQSHSISTAAAATHTTATTHIVATASSQPHPTAPLTQKDAEEDEATEEEEEIPHIPIIPNDQLLADQPSSYPTDGENDGQHHSQEYTESAHNDNNNASNTSTDGGNSDDGMRYTPRVTRSRASQDESDRHSQSSTNNNSNNNNSNSYNNNNISSSSNEASDGGYNKSKKSQNYDLIYTAAPAEYR